MNNIVSTLVGNMDAIKALKSRYILITKEYIYGVDEDFIIVRRCKPIYIVDIDMDYIYDMMDLNYLYKNCDYIKDIKPLPVHGFIDISFINSADNLVLRFLYNLIPSISKMISSINIGDSIDVDLTYDEEFNKLQEYKTGDGIYMYNWNGYMMSLYNNIIPRNKSDKVYLSISDQGPTFVACFKVDKKKIGRIDTYIRYIKLS